MKDLTHEDPRIVAAAERQMRAWVHSQEIQNRTTTRFDQGQRVRYGPYLTISRQAGAGGSEIGRRLGEKLGWEVLDRNVLDCIAERLHTSRELLQRLDERESNWAYDLMTSWLDREMVGHETYLRQLERAMLAAGRRGKVVLVGRGASFLLPRDGGLAVRLVASEEFRIERIMQQENMTRAAAREWVHTVERGRAEFVHRYFHRDIADPELYDMVLHVSRLGIDRCIEVILAAMKQ
jgi:cytidylate kinase